MEQTDTSSGNNEPGSQFTQEVNRLLDEIKGKDQKALILVLDKEIGKASDIAKDFNARGYAITSKQNGEIGVAFYQAFKQVDPKGPPVIIVMDGMFAPPDQLLPYNTGVEAAKKIVEISQTNGWEMPYFMGGSSMTEHNRRLQQTYPDRYIAAYRVNDLSDTIKNEIFGKIAAKVNPPS